MIYESKDSLNNGQRKSVVEGRRWSTYPCLVGCQWGSIYWDGPEIQCFLEACIWGMSDADPWRQTCWDEIDVYCHYILLGNNTINQDAILFLCNFLHEFCTRNGIGYVTGGTFIGECNWEIMGVKKVHHLPMNWPLAKMHASCHLEDRKWPMWWLCYQSGKVYLQEWWVNRSILLV